MFRINSWKVLLDWVNITHRPILQYVSANWKDFLLPSAMEQRENRVDIVDEENWLCEVYFHWELECLVRWYTEAKKYLQYLVDQEDYEMWNEKDYWEFEF